jgi:hypothetical protein
MGVWGSGLYSGDFALDLRAAIRAVVRLPFNSDRLAEILCESEPTAANDPTDEDHTTFWLIVADQFARRGIVCDRVRQKAFKIIDAGEDIATLKELGMAESELRKRRKVLQDVRTRVAVASVSKPRAVLKPQPLLMDLGDIIIFPTRGGACFNPYYPKARMNMDGAAWIPDGWTAAVIVGCGRVFEFLSWYTPLTVTESRQAKPDVDQLRGDILWRLRLPGTCSPIQFKRMELEKIGSLAIDPEKVRGCFPDKWLSPSIAVAAAVEDRSLGNELDAGPYNRPRGFDPTLRGIEKILQDTDQQPRTK